MKGIKLLLWGLMTLLISTCKEALPPPELSFYHWKSSLRLGEKEKEYMETLGLQKLYVRYFDIDWNPNTKNIVPIGELKVLETEGVEQVQEIIPCIFITQKSMLHIPAADIDTFAQKIVSKIQETQQLLKNKWTQLKPIQAIQLDCDWSAKSRGAYFALIEAIQKIAQSWEVQSTLRLHQYRYPQKTGVPKVKDCILMAYNMGDLSKLQTQNSIVDLKILDEYLKNAKKYPKQLKLALPIFSWGVLIRSGRVIDLFNGLRPPDLLEKTETDFLEVGHFQFQAQHSQYFQGRYLYKGDILRIEYVSPKLLIKSARLIRSRLKQEIREIIFYHLDEKNLAAYRPEDFLQIRNIFR